MKSFIQKPHEVDRQWFVVDAEGQTLGRLASQVASVLRGKHKVTFTQNVDCGDFVIIVNADKIKFTGKKLDQKMYRWHTGYVGHLRERTARQMMATKPEEVVRLAIKGMLPKNSLGRQMYTKLNVYAGPEHKHQAQKPEVLKF
ncbi:MULTISPECIES: 50S ribosomal protein L13 [unclassified Fusibacter]|uniref:50S ribosomal protein L13 n=1 Tax=unclassified Fusibacter TaxID=2624464 RepID=UPI001010858D|nr:MULTISPECIES: 50S ribosomal protein L13 [unclassified Fusibacter]MCK8061547.1 50S ribosomal protein L13 [Fusibacter sp. A2]NPE23725.1 50S ribosomal protein L13 [Fusibacter sp. A1]RXV58752.1 50S ribosomal protein L13 [Fusibacter sp. A1]